MIQAVKLFDLYDTDKIYRIFGFYALQQIIRESSQLLLYYSLFKFRLLTFQIHLNISFVLLHLVNFYRFVSYKYDEKLFTEKY